MVANSLEIPYKIRLDSFVAQLEKLPVTIFNVEIIQAQRIAINPAPGTTWSIELAGTSSHSTQRWIFNVRVPLDNGKEFIGQIWLRHDGEVERYSGEPLRRIFISAVTEFARYGFIVGSFQFPDSA
ncbi:hypothetical protein FRC03_008576 [Tulasnella sp. 419]|nr:hypothetical protein FRC02_007717 [Tulasnella sp. 418]KAG8958966.1 hypothetical protein FRC03_008576 [Tulasnella sp. 419]